MYFLELYKDISFNVCYSCSLCHLMMPMQLAVMTVKGMLMSFSVYPSRLN